MVVRCFHGILAGLLLWSFGTAGLCQAQCDRAPIRAEAAADLPGEMARMGHGGHGSHVGHAQGADRPLPSPAGHCDPMPAPPASDGSAEPPACFCAIAPGAPLQAKGDDGRSAQEFALATPTQRAVSRAGALQRHPAGGFASVALATHQHRNPPLLI